MEPTCRSVDWLRTLEIDFPNQEIIDCSLESELESRHEVVRMSTHLNTCMAREVLSGSRPQSKELVRFIDEKKILPAVDEVVFELAEAKGAYRRLQEKKHFSKVLIRIDHS